MIVVDANIVIYFVCQTPWTDLAQRVHSSDGDWVVPEIWEPEVLNGLMVMKRGGLLDLDVTAQLSIFFTTKHAKGAKNPPRKHLGRID